MTLFLVFLIKLLINARHYRNVGTQSPPVFFVHTFSNFQFHVDLSVSVVKFKRYTFSALVGFTIVTKHSVGISEKALILIRLTHVCSPT